MSEENQNPEVSEQEVQAKEEAQKTADKQRQEADEKRAPVQAANKDTKEALKLVFAVLKVLKEAKQNDGVISPADVALLPNLFPHIGPALDNVENISNELRNLDAAKIKDLLVFTSVQVGNIVSEVNDELVEKALKAAVAMVDLIAHLAVEDK